MSDADKSGVESDKINNRMGIIYNNNQYLPIYKITRGFRMGFFSNIYGTFFYNYKAEFLNALNFSNKKLNANLPAD